MSRNRKTPKPAPPAVRGRRGHPVIPEISGLKEWLVDQFRQTPRPTLTEIHAELKRTGFWRQLQELGRNGIGRTTIWQFYVEQKAREADKELALDIAADYNKAGSDRGPLDLETATMTMLLVELQKTFVKAIASGAALDVESAELFRKLSAVAAQIEKAKHLITRGRREALAIVRRELTDLLKKKPDTLRVVVETIDAIERREA